MANTIYDDLLRAAQALLQFGGYLTTQEQQQEQKARAAFNSKRNAAVYHLLQDHDAAAARAKIDEDFAAIRADTDDYFQPVIDFTQGELHERLDQEAGKSPLRRRLVRWLPVIVVVLLLAVAGGVRLATRVPVTHRFETQAGLSERAAAFRKAYRHAQWTDTRRNRTLVEIVTWPIAPNAIEAQAAVEFFQLVIGGRSVLAQAGQACGTPPAGAQISDADVTFVHGIARTLETPGMRWQRPAQMTLLPLIAQAYPCSAPPATSGPS